MRIDVRLKGFKARSDRFGGWEFGPDVLKQKDWVKTAYAKGVPMGSDLPAAKAKLQSISFSLR